MSDNTEIFRRLLAEAERRDMPIATLSMGDIATVTELSRSSLYRRFGSRAGLNTAVEAAGFVPGERISAEDKLIAAAHSLIVHRGVQSLTLEAVAESAKVALPTVYSLFRNRARLMRAMFTRYSPIPRIAAIVPLALPTDPAGFLHLIETMYLAVWDYFDEEHALLIAILSEVMRDPQSEVMDWLREEYVPMVANTIFPLLERAMEEGILRPESPILTAQLLIGPMLMHFGTRSIVTGFGISFPGRETTCAEFASKFCRANLKETHS